jgi:glycosyltransferase involved in cell wall biosynthesis
MSGERVAHVTTIDMSVRFLLLDQLQYLQTCGYEVHAICASGPWTDEIRSLGVPVHPVEFSRGVEPGRDVSSFLRLVGVLRKLRPRLVHTHTPKASLLGQYAALAAGVPLRVHTIHGLYSPVDASPVLRRALLALEATTMRPAHRVLSQSAEDLETCRRLRLVREDRLQYLGNGIDLMRFRPPSPQERAAARRELGIDKDSFVVGAILRLVREKGCIEFARASRIAARSSRDLVFLLAGPLEPDKHDGVSVSELEGEAGGKVFRYVGMRPDVERLYWAMDLLAHPSHREGFPRVPMEASACGVPVVATDIRGTREVVSGDNGLLVPVRNPSALAEAIMSLWDAPEARVNLARQARSRAERLFDQTAVFRRVAEAYQELNAY